MARSFEWIPVTTLASGAELRVPLHTLAGAQPGPTLGLSALVHGNEPAPSIGIIRAVLERLDASELRGTLLAAPVLNPLGYAAMSRHTPEDGMNLNGAFIESDAGGHPEPVKTVSRLCNAPEVVCFVRRMRTVDSKQEAAGRASSAYCRPPTANRGIMAEQKVRWGVLSTSNIGRRAVLPAIQRSSNGELVAVASRDADKARAFAGELGIPRAYASYEQLLADPAIEAVYIPLPNSMHREWAIKAAQAGKHILCEKPLALSAAECAEMDAAARQNGVLLMEAFMYRFHPQTERVIELLRQGAIGEPRLIHAAFTFRLTNPANIRLQAELGGGSLMDVGCYCANVSRTLFGAEPIEVQAFASWSAGGVDEQLIGNLRFAGGGYVQFDSALTLARRETYEVVGTEGVIEAPVAFLPGHSDTIIRIRDAAGERNETIAGIDEYQLMAEHFAACVRGQASLRYLPAEAAANMRAIEALYRSARNGGRPEPVASPA